MPGTFSKSNRPKRPGAYFNFIGQEPVRVDPAQGSVVAVPITHDWGPFEEAVQVASFAEFQSIYGSSDDTPGYIAIRQCFEGEGLPGRGGAGAIIVYRAGSSSAAKAVKALSNTTPATAITLSARYEGTRGNDLRVTTQDYAADATKNELILLDGTVELERYVYTDADIDDLGDQINADSNWITAVVAISGAALAAVTSQAFASGNDGSTLVAGDWTTLMTALEVERFSVFAPYDLTDGSILTSLVTWAQGLFDNGKRFMVVVGGAAGESVTTANTRSDSISDPNFINVGIGTITDLDLGADGDEIDISTSQLAPRVAGILAARGEHASITAARLNGTKIKVGPTESEILTAFDGGTLVLGRDSHPTAPVRFEQALTTWKKSDAAADSSRPYLIYRQPKFIRTMQGIEADMSAFVTEDVIGQQQITQQVREAVLAEVKRLLRERELLGVIQGRWTAGIDQDPPPTDDDEFIGIALSIKFGRALEQIYFTVQVS